MLDTGRETPLKCASTVPCIHCAAPDGPTLASGAIFHSAWSSVFELPGYSQEVKAKSTTFHLSDIMLAKI